MRGKKKPKTGFKKKDYLKELKVQRKLTKEA